MDLRIFVCSWGFFLFCLLVFFDFWHGDVRLINNPLSLSLRKGKVFTFLVEIFLLLQKLLQHRLRKPQRLKSRHQFPLLSISLRQILIIAGKHRLVLLQIDVDH